MEAFTGIDRFRVNVLLGPPVGTVVMGTLTVCVVTPGAKTRVPDARIAEAVEVSAATVERVRERFVEQGLDAALDRKKQARPSRERKLDGQAEAHLVALACSDPPPGRARWTLRLLADKLVELEV